MMKERQGFVRTLERMVSSKPAKYLKTFSLRVERTLLWRTGSGESAPDSIIDSLVAGRSSCCMRNGMKCFAVTKS